MDSDKPMTGSDDMASGCDGYHDVVVMFLVPSTILLTKAGYDHRPETTVWSRSGFGPVPTHELTTAASPT